MRAWLFTILRNTFYSGLRKQRREIADLDGVYAAALVSMPEHDGRLAMRAFLHAFAQLPAQQRDIVTLVGVSGHSYDIASRMLGIPVGTAKSRLCRARVHLCAMLDRPLHKRPSVPPPRRAVPEDQS